MHLRYFQVAPNCMHDAASPGALCHPGPGRVPQGRAAARHQTASQRPASKSAAIQQASRHSASSQAANRPVNGKTASPAASQPSSQPSASKPPVSSQFSVYPGIRAERRIRASGHGDLSGHLLASSAWCILAMQSIRVAGREAYPGKRAMRAIRANGQCSLSGQTGNASYPGKRAIQPIRAHTIYPGNVTYPGNPSFSNGDAFDRAQRVARIHPFPETHTSDFVSGYTKMKHVSGQRSARIHKIQNTSRSTYPGIRANKSILVGIL
jgi:hypothetical protein